jgi:hypothetical protein
MAARRNEMSISKRNHEGYCDPTVYEAFTNIDRKERAAGRGLSIRPIVFICSPYAGDVEANVGNALLYCRMAYERGFLPLAPHVYFTRFLDDSVPEERQDGLFMGCILMTKCAEVWVFGTTFTEGMEREIQNAKRRNLPIRFFTREGTEVRT